MDDQEKKLLQDNAKEIYDSIEIPPELENVVKKTIESKDKESIDKQYKASHSTISEFMKYMGGAAAVIILSMIVGLNSSETFAKEMSEVPILGSVAKVFTIRNYTVEKETLIQESEEDSENQIIQEMLPPTISGNEYPLETDKEIIDTVSGNTVSGNDSKEEMKVTISGNDIVAITPDRSYVLDTLYPSPYPMTVSSNDMFENAAAANFTADINKKIEKYVQTYVSGQKALYEEYKKAFFAAGGTEKEWNDRQFDIQVDYEVKFNRGAIVSFVITANQEWSSTYNERTFYNLDLLNGKYVTLQEMLGDNYVNVANIQIVRQMQQRVKENPNYVYWGVTDNGASEGFSGFTTVDEYTNFYINANGNVVIVFDEYDVAPGFMGEQEFEIIVEKDYIVG